MRDRERLQRFRVDTIQEDYGVDHVSYVIPSFQATQSYECLESLRLHVHEFINRTNIKFEFRSVRSTQIKKSR